MILLQTFIVVDACATKLCYIIDYVTSNYNLKYVTRSELKYFYKHYECKSKRNNTEHLWKIIFMIFVAS